MPCSLITQWLCRFLLCGDASRSRKTGRTKRVYNTYNTASDTNKQQHTMLVVWVSHIQKRYAVLCACAVCISYREIRFFVFTVFMLVARSLCCVQRAQHNTHRILLWRCFSFVSHRSRQANTHTQKALNADTSSNQTIYIYFRCFIIRIV